MQNTTSADELGACPACRIEAGRGWVPCVLHRRDNAGRAANPVAHIAEARAALARARAAHPTARTP